MGRLRLLCLAIAVLLAACLLASCKDETGPVSEEESSAVQSSEEESSSDASESPGEAESASEDLPPAEAIVLLYTDYLTVRARQDGLVYEYTYCFDEAGSVFNAIAVIRFPTEEAAQREYTWLRKNSYPNLELDGASLSFCFPRKECPFYGIPYRSLEVLLEETVYEIVERHPPQPPEETSGPDET